MFQLSAYMFWCIFLVLHELQRIIEPMNPRYISEMKDLWENFYCKVHFYDVMKKAMKPPKTLDGGREQYFSLYMFTLKEHLAWGHDGNFSFLTNVNTFTVSWWAVIYTALCFLSKAAVFRALPQLFPSSTIPPKKLGTSSEAFFHVLTVRFNKIIRRHIKNTTYVLSHTWRYMK